MDANIVLAKQAAFHKMADLNALKKEHEQKIADQLDQLSFELMVELFMQGYLTRAAEEGGRK